MKFGESTCAILHEGNFLSWLCRRIGLVGSFMVCAASMATASDINFFYAGINHLHLNQCPGDAIPRSVLSVSASLETAALRRANGESLTDALAASADLMSASVLVVGGDAKTALGRLASRHCDKLADSGLNHMGAVFAKDRWWIVLGSQTMAMPAPAGSQTIPMDSPANIVEAVLARVNAARSIGQNCGGELFEAAPAIRWSTKLAEAAAQHARDMAVRRYFSHVSPKGGSIEDRVLATDYRFRAIGENIAAMPTKNADLVVQSWLNSPGHCANIMSRQFTEIGAAVASSAGAQMVHWVLVLGAPQ